MMGLLMRVGSRADWSEGKRRDWVLSKVDCIHVRAARRARVCAFTDANREKWGKIRKRPVAQHCDHCL